MIELFKYLSFKEDNSLEYREQLIAERILYFNEAHRFNDPLDCHIANWEGAQSYLKPARFFCLAMVTRNDNLMFAHYGDEHRGIRLKFSADEDQPISDCSVLALGKPVVYKHEIPVFEPSRAHDLYYLKSVSWGYEQEYRILALENTELQYRESELVEVALGARFNMALLPKLERWIAKGEHQNVKIVKAVPSKNFLEFEYVPVNA
ncbi:DUF2971 domain-containing protein [Neptunomonas antarctica]|uniref:DUF2971 domain-containing protein n=1 Tax=Neptunomonas antarctica TaxID=619304 RepID=A0A1N7LII5_9GAMM|nr:DUF2971 domain-containing protein [Neptunomonas antarctica]SIS73622.1 Protein of unknown function [Neptunomonas antarctica]